VAVPLIERYRDRLPVGEATPVVSLGEGSTPLIRARRLSERYGVELWLKLESANPTASFKDRGMTVAVSKAVEDGARAVICASTGNTAASAATYAARAGLPAVVLQPVGAVASGKLAQARAVGARVLEVRGTFDQALSAARELAERDTFVLVNSLNPYRIEGQKTVSFEIAEELGGVPNALLLPYGGGGNTRAVFRGFEEIGSMPRLLPTQSDNRSGTVASAIRIADPAHAEEVDEAVGLSDGRILTVSDDEILSAWTALAREEGVFCEPSSAAGLAGLAVAGLPSGATVVCIVTGHGLKDPELALAHATPPVTVEPDPDAIAEAAR
jgi:threonine synthase